MNRKEQEKIEQEIFELKYTTVPRLQIQVNCLEGGNCY